MVITPERPVPRSAMRHAGIRAALAGLLLTGALLPQCALAQSSSPPPASPSQPPFWARPQAVPADCACAGEEQPSAGAAASQGDSSAVVLASAAIAIALLLLMRVRRLNGTGKPAALPLAVRAGAATGRPDLIPAPARPRHTTRFSESYAPAGETDQIEIAESPRGEDGTDSGRFYAEVAASLASALEKEPDRQDLRRKLLEVYGAAGMASQFVRLAHEYLERNHGAPDRHWSSIAETGYRLAPEHELFKPASTTPSGAPSRKVVRQRRFYERKVNQGRLAIAQEDLAANYQRAKSDAAFQKTLRQFLADGLRRPSPLTPVSELGFADDSGQIFLKREDRRRQHDDALINAMGQAALAQYLKKTRIVTATKDGTHGQAVATVAARLGLECVVYIHVHDMYQYYARVLRMRQLGAQVRPVHVTPDSTLADPRQFAIEAWLDDPKHTLYVSGLTGGPHPYPRIVRETQTMVGREALEQVRTVMGGLPACVVAGSMDSYQGIGLIHAFVEFPQVKLYWVDDPENDENDTAGASASRRANELGPPPWTVPRVAREHHWLRETGRVTYVAGDANETLRVVEQFHTAGTTLFTASARSLAYARYLSRQLDGKAMVLAMLPNQDVSDLRGFSHDW